MVYALSLDGPMKKSATLFFPGEVSDEIRDFLLTCGERMILKKGKSLSKQSLLSNFVYVDSGFVFYDRRTNNYSKPKFSSVVLPERLTDYHLVLDDNCTCCKSIVAARDSELILLNKFSFTELINDDPALFSRFMMDAVYHTERQTALAIFLLTSNPEDKLTKFLFDSFVALGSDFDQEWLTLELKLTREEIANILHISVIKLDLMLGDLKKKGLMFRKNNKLQVNQALFSELSPCPLGREDANGCQSNNMDRYRVQNMVTGIRYSVD